MKPVLQAVALMFAANAATAAECTVEALQGFPLDRPALTLKQKNDAAAAISKITTMMVVSDKPQHVEVETVVLQMAADGLWQIVLNDGSEEGDQIAKTDTYGVKRKKALLKPDDFREGVKTSLTKSLAGSIEYKVKVQGGCWK